VKLTDTPATSTGGFKKAFGKHESVKKSKLDPSSQPDHIINNNNDEDSDGGDYERYDPWHPTETKT